MTNYLVYQDDQGYLFVRTPDGKARPIIVDIPYTQYSGLLRLGDYVKDKEPKEE